MEKRNQVAVECFHSVVEPGFWSVFAKRKLEDLRLSQEAVQVSGWFGSSRSELIPPQLRVAGEDVLVDHGSGSGAGDPNVTRAKGKLTNVNTLEEFKAFDKKKLAEELKLELMATMNGAKESFDAANLVPFHILSFADLKRHKFLYWFCFPALVDEGWKFSDLKPATEMFDAQEMNEIFSKRLLGVFAFDSSDGKAKPLHVCKQIKALCMLDPCSSKEKVGWPLHNALFWVKSQTDHTNVKVCCIRESLQESVVINAEMENRKTKPTVLGWEPNAQNKMGPRLMDLSDQLDPQKLSQAACDLNLKLMRWRALPSLDVPLLASTSCLLIGSGTLGCAVARTLLGWGLRNITMLDNGKVSYSNPSRQSLFKFQDCIEAKPKAIAAAEAIREILPDVNAEGFELSVPMPGHFVSTRVEEEEVREAVLKLEMLIQNHDAIFLLTDTRESRWLPSLIGATHDKVILNAALGFDSFMVMRHGAGPMRQDSTHRLGCYFCNDVVAPQNSMKDRTLDQQCTVTRPGLAPIAGALAAELLVGLLHHPEKHAAPATGADDGPFGSVPHQIRGSVATFVNNSMTGQAFPQCTACSHKVVDVYKNEGFTFLLKAFNEPNYLEDLTGLTELLAKNEGIDEDAFFEDDDNFWV